MPWSEIALHSLALVAYPGAVTLIALGALAEVAAGWAVTRQEFLPPRSAARLGGGRTIEPTLVAAALMATLAATQAAFPLNPVPDGERSLLVAAIALATATWAVNSPGSFARRLLAVQCAWMLAVFAPAVVPESLRPETLGSVFVERLLPLKVVSAVLYLLCLPVLLQLLPGERGQAGVRILLWLPYSALFTSLYFPPTSDDLGGLLRFFGISAAAAAVVIGLAALLTRREAMTRVFSAWLVMPLAWITLGLAMLTAAVR